MVSYGITLRTGQIRKKYRAIYPKRVTITVPKLVGRKVARIYTEKSVHRGAPPAPVNWDIHGIIDRISVREEGVGNDG